MFLFWVSSLSAGFEARRKFWPFKRAADAMLANEFEEVIELFSVVNVNG